MDKVGRIVPPNKQVLRDISLGFYYGAKIGVLGLNGAGKSTLLRIIAGVDKDYIGEIFMSKGYTVGLLEQEPKLDETGTVISVVKEAVHPIVDMLRRYDEVNAKFAEPDADFDALVAEQAKLQEQLDKHDAWNLDSHLEVAMDALRCPPADTPIKILSGGEKRRVASPGSCSPNRISSCSTSPPTTSTPRASSGWSSSCRNSPAPWWR